MDEHTCPDDIHIHPVSALIVFHGYSVAGLPATILANDRVVADRLVDLVRRYGLVDVPEDAREVACPWPPPDPDLRADLSHPSHHGEPTP